MTSAFKWIATWIVFLAALSILASSNWGKGIVYWSLWLLVALLLVTHAEKLAELIDIGALNLNG